MKFIQNLLLLLVFTGCLAQITDYTFRNYCEMNNAEVTIQTIGSGNGVVPAGDRCRVILNLPAANQEEAQRHCERWTIHVLRKAEVHEGVTACHVENAYECGHRNYVQMRGMCYRKDNTLRNYHDAVKFCQNDNAEVLKIHSKHTGELFEEHMRGLTMYFIQPDDNLEVSSQYAGGNGSNFLILFTASIYYDVGPNAIVRVGADAMAHTMCMFKPPETILSFAVKAEKLGLLYHPTQLVGSMAVWRTASYYTPTNIPGYPNNHTDICEASMKAILGTSDGTLLNLNPEYTQHLSVEVKSSFNQVFGPFLYCEKARGQVVYFLSKEVVKTQNPCLIQSTLIESEYNANWNLGQKPFKHSFVYYPESTNGVRFEARRFAIHAPMLCGLHFKKDPFKPNGACPPGWFTMIRDKKDLICHRYFAQKLQYWAAQKFCEDMGADISRWETEEEYEEFQGYRDTRPSNYQFDAWVKCLKSKGCKEKETKPGGAHGDMRHKYLSSIKDFDQSVFCEKPAEKF